MAALCLGELGLAPSIASQDFALLGDDRLSASMGEYARRKAVVALDVQKMIDDSLAVLKKGVSQSYQLWMGKR